MNEPTQALEVLPPKPTPMIYARISKVMADIRAVGKNGRNREQNYDFRSIDDFYDAAQPALVQHEVVIIPTILEVTREERTTKSGSKLVTTLTRNRYKICTVDGSFIEADALGEGADAGDKSANKAASGAMKYLLQQVFCVRIRGEAHDSEQDSFEYASPPKPISAPEPSPQTVQPTKIAPRVPTARTVALSGADATWESWLEKLKARALSLFKPYEMAAWCFAVKEGWILDTERMDAARPSKMFVILDPTKGIEGNKERAINVMDDYMKSVQGLAARLEVAPDPHWQAKYAEVYINADQIPGAEVPVPAPKSEANSSQGGQDHEQPDSPALRWRKYIWNIPPKGIKRQDYMRDPNTLGYMYDAGPKSYERAQLFGNAEHYVPKEWVDRMGKTRMPSDEDKKFREGLDLFKAWHEEKTRREKAVRAND